MISIKILLIPQYMVAMYGIHSREAELISMEEVVGQETSMIVQAHAV